MSSSFCAVKAHGCAQNTAARKSPDALRVADGQVQSGDKRGGYRAGAGSNPDKLFPG